MGQNLYSFIEVPVFTKRLHEIASLDVLFEIQADLLEMPDRWPVIPGTHGARKGRVGDPAKRRGKSGSFRYLYFYVEHRGHIYLIYLFAKGEQDNLTPAQKRIIAKLVDAIKGGSEEKDEEGQAVYE